MSSLQTVENQEWLKHQNQKILTDIYPKWFHPHGHKFGVELDMVYQLQLTASAAKIDITLVEPKLPEDQRFKLEWEIIHFGNEGVWGRSVWDRKTLECAFAIDDDCHISGVPFVDYFGGTSAYAGKYIRHERCLNIPGPGNGNDGEANLSLLVSDSIKEAMSIFLNHRLHLVQPK